MDKDTRNAIEKSRMTICRRAQVQAMTATAFDKLPAEGYRVITSSPLTTPKGLGRGYFFSAGRHAG